MLSNLGLAYQYTQNKLETLEVTAAFFLTKRLILSQFNKTKIRHLFAFINAEKENLTFFKSMEETDYFDMISRLDMSV
ncbi:hypothetical protein H9655_11600 [Cytobacillus sp. Sa5YUA1]|uniref:Uncharacterized protein n=1 Tax=Cytobacillus stercorigallinarum TaxID=2762240 RepID=A0ABR8QQ46_9BACI|nr:hypothetical protein [Cytobacillus stercorigallinarum]MBD7937665.1 hypothetical protein [Cytobacillus stercorigallinarum]